MEIFRNSPITISIIPAIKTVTEALDHKIDFELMNKIVPTKIQKNEEIKIF
tara:strand:- start:157 stop:309 length:153 start_codon:yes stop_codon:yes gene_type:complete